MKKVIFATLLIFSLVSCNKSNNSQTIVQKNRNNIIDISDKITYLNTDLIFGISEVRIVNNLFIVQEMIPYGDKCMHVYNRSSFEFIKSIGTLGKGPGEMVRPGKYTLSLNNQTLYIPDFGKNTIWKFNLDSALLMDNYLPSDRIAVSQEIFTDYFEHIDDKTGIGTGVNPINHHSFYLNTVKIDLTNGKVKSFGYRHPLLEGKKGFSDIKLSKNKNFYINCYADHDLITVCNIDGSLRFNILGKDWNEEEQDMTFFTHIDLYKNYIITAYSGISTFYRDKTTQRVKSNFASKLMIFNTTGEYVSTAELGKQFSNFCIDEKNERIIFYFVDKEPQLGYINLKEIQL